MTGNNFFEILFFIEKLSNSFPSFLFMDMDLIFNDLGISGFIEIGDISDVTISSIPLTKLIDGINFDHMDGGSPVDVDSWVVIN